MGIKRLIQQFKEKFNWEGKNAKELIVNIFASNKKKLQESILQDTFNEYKKQEKYLGKLNLPKPSDLLSNNNTLVKLSVIDSEKVTDKLKSKLRKDLNNTILALQGKDLFKDGNLVSDKFVSTFKGKLEKTFSSYIKEGKIKDSKLKSIAVTESRNIINNLKYAYALKVADNNTDVIIEKEWQHYPNKSDNPRQGHAEKDKERIDLRDYFKVNHYNKGKQGLLVYKGTDYMFLPHDVNASARQNVNCNCDIRFIIRKKL